jgi:hypothetical protein
MWLNGNLSNICKSSNMLAKKKMCKIKKVAFLEWISINEHNDAEHIPFDAACAEQRCALGMDRNFSLWTITEIVCWLSKSFNWHVHLSFNCRSHPLSSNWTSMRKQFTNNLNSFEMYDSSHSTKHHLWAVLTNCSTQTNHSYVAIVVKIIEGKRCRAKSNDVAQCKILMPFVKQLR